MPLNDSKSYLGHLNKLVDEYNTYHCSIGKKPFHADYSALSKEIESSYKSPKFKLVIESELLSIKIFLAKVTLKIGQKKYFLLILC